jgi:hypothetical protein
MRDIEIEQPAMKRYLLGQLDEDGKRQLEEQFVTDAEFREIALVVEDDLIDDYLAGLLPADEKTRFDRHYLSAPRQRQALAMAKALRDYALESEATAFLPAPTEEPGRKIRVLLYGQRWLPTLAIAASLLIITAIAWGLIRWRWGTNRPTFNMEVSVLNKRPLGGEPALSVTLKDALDRAPQQGQKVSLPDGINIVQLQLKIARQNYQRYQATLHVVDGPEVFTVGDLTAEETAEGHLIKLRIPARLLGPKDYILSISGLTDDGRVESIADYFFRVVR